MKHLFKTLPNRIPKAGDLIKNIYTTPNYINLVLYTKEIKDEQYGKGLILYSVRYGHTNKGNFTLLKGRRVVPVKWFSSNNWQVVEEKIVKKKLVEVSEVLPYDNSQAIELHKEYLNHHGMSVWNTKENKSDNISLETYLNNIGAVRG